MIARRYTVPARCMVRARSGYHGCTLWISAAAITPSLRCRGDLCSGGSGFLISMGVPVRYAPRIQAPGPGGPSIPPSPIPGAGSALDALAALYGRVGVGASGFAQKGHGTGLLLLVGGWARGVGVTLNRPGKTAGVINGHRSIAPRSNASNTTEMTSALRRRLRARCRDSESYSSMHCDKLPRSLTDTPPANRS